MNESFPVPEPAANPELQQAMHAARQEAEHNPGVNREVYDGSGLGFGPTLIDSVGNDTTQIHALNEFYNVNHKQAYSDGGERVVSATSGTDPESDRVTVTRTDKSGDTISRHYEGKQATRLMRPLGNVVVNALREGPGQKAA